MIVRGIKRPNFTAIQWRR